MKKGKGIYRKIFKMLTKRQKINFIIIIIIMIISALLTQLLPLSIGSLTDDVLSRDNLSFVSVLKKKHVQKQFLLYYMHH